MVSAFRQTGAHFPLIAYHEEAVFMYVEGIRNRYPVPQGQSVMLAGSLLIGAVVIAVAFWLEYNDRMGWPNEQEREHGSSNTRDDRYRMLRRRWRRTVHIIIAVCGALMASAGVAGPGRYWIAAWTAVALLMMTIIVLAMGDAIRTHRYYADKLRRQRDNVA
jgi:hypothetical protein